MSANRSRETLQDELGAEPRTVFSGRYAMFFSGRECGEERWLIEATPDHLVARGEQVITAPHPFPNHQQYRVTLTHDWRVTGLEVEWVVGERTLHATHSAAGEMWRARIAYADHVKEQEGDYPSGCEVDFTTHLFSAFILQRRDFALDGEHEFPVLTIGPPYMAVTPGRLLYHCVEVGSYSSPLGARAAKRYRVSRPPENESEGYTFWADEDGIVLESYEGHDASRPWMRLVEYRQGG